MSFQYQHYGYTGLIHREQMLRSIDTLYPTTIVSRSREFAVIWRN